MALLQEAEEAEESGEAEVGLGAGGSESGSAAVHCAQEGGGGWTGRAGGCDCHERPPPSSQFSGELWEFSSLYSAVSCQRLVHCAP
jgi:hypothetical protein